MKYCKIILFAVLFFWAAPPIWCETSNIISSGSEFVELLSKHEFSGAVRRFDATMKTALPETKLRETWQSFEANAGPFQKQVSARKTELNGYDIALITCQFRDAALIARVIFDSTGKVAGLFFTPTDLKVKPSGPPPYADTNRFHETSFTVGKGERKLPGTLSLPNQGTAPFPVVVLVHGSGPEDRDETIGANKPFRDLAWGLASQGVAVLRYEKRTKQFARKYRQSGLGQFTVREETMDDALSAANQLRDVKGINEKRIFILGHSLGGMLAPRIAQADPRIARIIILAGCVDQPLEDLMVEQIHYLISANGKSSKEGLATLASYEASAAKIKQLTARDITSTNLLLGAPPAYWLDLRAYNALSTAQRITQPMLILQGERDYQVVPAGFYHWKAALAGNTNASFNLYPQLNHLFMAGEGPGRPEEYAIPGHVAESVINDIAVWIHNH